MIVIPLTSDPCQVVTVTLDSVEYDLTVKWGELRQRWSLDILRRDDQASLVRGLALVLGVDILAARGLDIGQLYMVDESAQGAEATSADGDLGGRVKLFYFSPGES